MNTYSQTYIDKIESFNLNLLIGLSKNKIISLMLLDHDLIDFNDTVMVFKLRGLKPFWAIKYFYISFHQNLVFQVSFTRLRKDTKFYEVN